MKVFKNPLNNWLYFGYRLIEPIIDPIKVWHGITGYVWFFRDMISFKNKGYQGSLINTDLFPQLHDKSTVHPFDAHYFYQQLWAFEKVLKAKPSHHVDIASTYEMSGYLSKIVPTTYVDFRPVQTTLKNLTLLAGDILQLPQKTGSLSSVSCLHVIEHIGLGRYGDPIDPEGLIKACQELSRIVKKGGHLYLSTPIGKKRLCFNAHRITPPDEIVKLFPEMKLKSFSVIDDDGHFIENTSHQKYISLAYGCGLFEFIKK